MSKNALTVENLTKIYLNSKSKKENKALNNLTFNVKEGEVFGLLGPNGAGKTTTIGIITGLVKLQEGSVSIFGKDIIKDFRFTRSKIGVSPQDFNSDWFFSIEKLLLFQAGYYGIPSSKAKHIVDDIMKKLGIYEKRKNKIRTLSGGMKRRFQIAKALVNDPDILIMDEPTAGVDVELRKDMWKVVEGLRKTGVTIILTTHYIEEAEAIADRVAVINQGEIIVVDNKIDLLKKMGHKKLTIELQDKVASIPSELDEYNLSISNDNYSLIYNYNLHAERTGITKMLQDLKNAGLRMRDLKTEQNNLEKIFVTLVKENNED